MVSDDATYQFLENCSSDLGDFSPAPKMRKTNGTHAWAHTHTQATEGGKRKGARKGERVIREVESGANTPCWGAPAFIIFDTRFAKTQIILDISSKGKQQPIPGFHNPDPGEPQFEIPRPCAPSKYVKTRAAA